MAGNGSARRLLQRGFERLTRPCQTREHGTWGNVQRLGHQRRGHVIKVVKHQHFAVNRGDARQGLDHVQLRIQRIVVVDALFVRFIQRLGPQLRRIKVAKGVAAHDLEQPGTGHALVTQLVPEAPCAGEAVLHHVFGRGAQVLAHAQRIAAREREAAEQAELAKLRAEASAREQKDREERIAREAAERAQREAEAKAQAERETTIKREADAQAAAERRELELKLQAERAEREKAEAIQREQQAKTDAERREAEAVAAEQRRVAAIADAEAKEAKRREADKAHKTAINRAALDAFVAGGMTEECAKLAVTLIAKKAIPAISISY